MSFFKGLRNINFIKIGQLLKELLSKFLTLNIYSLKFPQNMLMKKNLSILYFLAFIKFILPFLLQNNIYDPQRDELLYLAEAHHMAWGYMEIPPLLSVFAWFTNLFGAGMFWIKFWPALFGAFTYIVVGKIIISLGGRVFALFLGLLPFIFGAYLRVHFLFQPNFLEIFFWTMIAFSIIRYIQTEKNSWLYILGISAGLGMVSKYSVAFFIVSILMGLLLTEQRKIFLNKHLYFAALIAFIIFLPTLLWEYNHHFPIIVHMKELQQTQLKYVNPVSFLMDQILMNLPCVFIWIAGLYFIIFKRNGKRYNSIAWAYLFVIVLLLYFQGKSYYSLGVYPVLIGFGAYHLEQFVSTRPRIWKYAFVIIPFALGIPLVPLLLPVAKPETLAAYYKATHIEKIGFLKWEDQKNHPLPQDFADMLGWKEITEKTAKAYSTLNPEGKKNSFIFCDNYGEAGAVNFYGKKYHLPEAYSDNASFLYWLPDSMHIDNIILVTDDQQEMQHDFLKDFSSVTLTDSVTNPFARERGSLILILKGANEKMNQMFQEKIKRDKDRFK